MLLSAVFVGAVLLQAVLADVYFQSPRGSNNRLNEPSAQRRNANRAFDSQNNNRGGYNVGDKTDKKASNEAGQYRTIFFQSGPGYTLSTSTSEVGRTYVTLEWLNQHGCGGDEDTNPHKLNCNLVVQYMAVAEGEGPDKDMLRNGVNTGSQSYQKNGRAATETKSQAEARKNGRVRTDRVLQDTFQWYDKCNNRDRNKGLFTADQNLKGDSAIYTRQNPAGTRRGYECPEERDYYPYWHPTEWKDILVLADNETQCDTYRAESFNVKTKWECRTKYPGTKEYRPWSKENNEEECVAEGGEWMEFTNFLEVLEGTDEAACNVLMAAANPKLYEWARPYLRSSTDPSYRCLRILEAPECYAAPRTRVNHLGNTASGNPIRYRWTVPHFKSGNLQNIIMRVRYNISTDDYDPFHTDSSHNADPDTGKLSPVQNNPAVDVGLDNQPLRLAINTAQLGRTFQDRSHIIQLEKRPDGLERQVIHNVNVRGKRGNIVQVYPAVEYDFIPNDLTIKAADLVQFQWAGSNSHNNGNPGGDGQTGDAGEGTAGTDRHNIVEVKDLNNNFPTPYENAKMFAGATVKWTSHPIATMTNIQPDEVALSYASAGYYSCFEQVRCGGESVAAKPEMNNLLNNANASYRGMLLKFREGVYYYICSRNNSFTNRSQKATLTVEA